MKLLYFLLFLLTGPYLTIVGQEDGIQFEKFYRDRAETALEQNNWDVALENFEKLRKKLPGSTKYDYQIALTYYRMQDFRKASEFASAIVQREPGNLDAHRLYANSLDLLDNYQGAKDHLMQTIAQYPNDGELFFDMGVIEYLRGNDQAAMDVWEDGIKADPYFSDNYYWATKMYSESNKPIWALMYGEMFLNIEKGTERFAEISNLLMTLYRDYADRKASSYILISVNHPERNKFEEAFNQTYSTMRQNGLMDLSSLGHIIADGSHSDIRALSSIREKFIDLWSQTQQAEFRVPLFEWQKQMLDDGHLDAYMHWLFLNAEPNYFLSWQKTHREAFDNFLMYMGSAPLRIDVMSYFMRKDHINH